MLCSSLRSIVELVGIFWTCCVPPEDRAFLVDLCSSHSQEQLDTEILQTQRSELLMQGMVRQRINVLVNNASGCGGTKAGLTGVQMVLILASSIQAKRKIYCSSLTAGGPPANSKFILRATTASRPGVESMLYSNTVLTNHGSLCHTLVIIGQNVGNFKVVISR